MEAKRKKNSELETFPVFPLVSYFAVIFLNSVKNYTFSTPWIKSFYYLCNQKKPKEKDGTER